MKLKKYSDFINEAILEYPRGVKDYPKSLVKEIEDLIKKYKLELVTLETFHEIKKELKYYQDYRKISGISSFYKNISEELIRLLKNDLDWDMIEKYSDISEDFMWEFKHKININNISKYKKLSKDILLKFYRSLHLPTIKRTQKLSDDFMTELKTLQDKDKNIYYG